MINASRYMVDHIPKDHPVIQHERHGCKKGLSHISGEGSSDLQGEVFDVAITASYALDHVDPILAPSGTLVLSG